MVQGRTAASTPAVLACGLATLDVVQTVDEVPGPDQKVVARDLWTAAGGPAANAAATAAALGVRARLVTRIGDSPAGRLVTEDLLDRGVEVHDRAARGTSPAVSTVLVTGATGQRAVVSVNATGPVGDAGTALDLDDLLAGAAVLLVDGHHLDLALALAAGARERGVLVLLDGGSWKHGLGALLAVTDVAVLSADFRLPAGSTDQAGAAVDLRQVAALGPPVVAQSHGSGPIRLLHGGAVVEIPVPPVEVADSLGAGDVLHGALAAWLAVTGRTAGNGVVGHGLTFAAEVASRSCTAPGAHGWVAAGAEETRDRLRAAAWRR